MFRYFISFLISLFIIIEPTTASIDSLWDQLKNEKLNDSLRLKIGSDINKDYLGKEDFLNSEKVYEIMAEIASKSKYEAANYVLLENKMAAAWFKLDYVAAKSLLKQLIKEARYLDRKKSIAKCYLNLSKITGNLEENVESKLYLDSAFIQFKILNDPKTLAQLYSQYASLAYDDRKPQLAINYYLKALKIYDSINKPQDFLYQITYNLDGVGNIYAELPNAKKALEYYFKSIKLYEDYNYTIPLTYTHHNIAVVYKELLKDNRNAKKHFLLALKYAEDHNNVYALNSARISISASYITESKYDSALYQIKEAFQSMDTLQLTKMIGNAYINKGICLSQKGDFKKALKNLEYGLNAAKRNKNLELKSKAYSALVKVCLKHKDLKGADENFENYRNCSDSLIASTVENEIASIEAKYSLEKNKLEKKSLEEKRALVEEKVNQKTNLNYLFGFLIIVLIVFIIQILRSQQRLQSKTKILTEKNNVIQNQKSKVEELYKVNTKLISGLSHDVATPFSSIIGLVFMLKESGNLNKEQAEIADLIEQSANKGVALTREIVNAQKNQTRFLAPIVVKEEFDASNLMNTIIRSFEPLANSKGIQLHSDIDSELTITSDKSFISRIADNLISNAIKFSPSNKNVFIHLNKTSNQLILTVRDEGLGFSIEDKEKLFKSYQKLSAKPTAGESSTGLGLSIIKALVDKLEGKIYLKSEKNNGSEFRVEFPV